MSRLLYIDVAPLTEDQRGAIAAAAGARGFDVAFGGDARDAEIIFSGDASHLSQAQSLRWLCVPSAGTEQYQAALKDRPEVLLTSSSGAYGVTISEHVVMVTLELMRRQMDYNAVVARRGWVRTLPVRSIRNSRITLLGTGDIGRETALRMKAFGPKSITGINRSGHKPDPVFQSVYPISELDRVLPKTDLLILSLPDTRETRGVMSASRLAKLPEDAFIVNVGRGQAIDQAALMDRLKAGKLAGAALDVFVREPLPEDDPLWECPRLLITPHVAGNMTLPYTVERIAELFLENFERYCAGEPLKRAITGKRGY